MTNDPRLIKLPKGSMPEPWANGKPWTSNLDSELKNDWQSGMELLPILKKYGRTPIAIFSRLRQLGELSEDLNPVELWNAMNSKDEKGLWDLAKGLTSEVWDISKVVGKEAPGLIKELAKETREAVKSYSENSKVDAQKHRLKHIENMKKLRKRAKDAGISEESLTKESKDFGVAEGKSEDTPSESEGSVSLLNGINCQSQMFNESMIEVHFEQYISSFNSYKKMYKKLIEQGDERALALAKKIVKDCGFTLSEIECSTNEKSVKDAGTSEEYLAKLKKDFGVTPSESEGSSDAKGSHGNINRSEDENPHGVNTKQWKKESDSKPIFNSFFSSLIENYLSNYQAIERGEILRENLIPRKASRNNFRAVCRGEKKAVTAHEQAYMAWKKLDRPSQKGSTETTINIDLP